MTRVDEFRDAIELEHGGLGPSDTPRAISGVVEEGEEVIVVEPGGDNVVTVESLAAKRTRSTVRSGGIEPGPTATESGEPFS